MAKAYLIDPETRTINSMDYQPITGFPGIFKAGLCVGMTYQNGDVLYVDDECLLRVVPTCGGFVAKSRADGQPLFDKAVLVGREFDTASGGWSTHPPLMTIKQAEAEFQFLSREEALAWFRERADQPAVWINHEPISPWADILLNLEGEPGGYHPRDHF